MESIIFNGLWTIEQQQELRDVITNSSENVYQNSTGYNYWVMVSLDDGRIWSHRVTWDMGGLSANSYSEYLEKFKNYYE